jgi:hypothetical protein
MIVQMLIKDESFVEKVLDDIEACVQLSIKVEVTHDNTILKMDGPVYEIAVILLEMTNWINVDTVLL